MADTKTCNQNIKRTLPNYPHLFRDYKTLSNFDINDIQTKNFFIDNKGEGREVSQYFVDS